MSIGFVFWLLMVLWIVFGGAVMYPRCTPEGRAGFLGNSLFLFILLFLIGWKIFGFILHE